MNSDRAVLRSILGLCLAASFFFQAHAQSTPDQPNPVLPHKPLVLLVSIDGFRADYLDRGFTPQLSKLAASGTHADRLKPVFPSITFPNHYALVTGLYPDHNGIVNNTMVDPQIPAQEFNLSNRAAIENPLWWQEGTPIWETVVRSGGIASTLFWPGSEAKIHGLQPQDWLTYEGGMSPSKRVKTLLSWLNREDSKRADFATLYFSQVDSKGHGFGPDSDEVNAALLDVDQAIGELLEGLTQLHLKEMTTLVIVSDHGMMTVPSSHGLDLSRALKSHASAQLLWSGPIAGIEVKPAEEKALLADLILQDHLQCWAKRNMPERFHFGQHRRIPSVLCLSEPGWSVEGNSHGYKSVGQHGFDNAISEMQGLFIVVGPRIKVQNIPQARSIDVYNLLAHLSDVPAQPNDGADGLFDLVRTRP
jgi:predicted AlkP superfamily pyrophosphatase or phosphodiesterase